MSSSKKTGQIFKQAREALGLTQLDAAKMAGIHPNTLAKIERGLQKPLYPTIKKLVKVLDININDIPA